MDRCLKHSVSIETGLLWWGAGVIAELMDSSVPNLGCMGKSENPDYHFYVISRVLGSIACLSSSLCLSESFLVFILYKNFKVFSCV